MNNIRNSLIIVTTAFLQAIKPVTKQDNKIQLQNITGQTILAKTSTITEHALTNHKITTQTTGNWIARTCYVAEKAIFYLFGGSGSFKLLTQALENANNPTNIQKKTTILRTLVKEKNELSLYNGILNTSNVSIVRRYSTQSSTIWNPSRWNDYVKSDDSRKFLLSLDSGLELLGIKVLNDDIEGAWKKNSSLPNYNHKDQRENLSVLISALSLSYQKPNRRLSVGEMMTILRTPGIISPPLLTGNNSNTLSSDAEKGLDFIIQCAMPDVRLTEYGSFNGGILGQITVALLQQGNTITALGTDIDPTAVAMANIFANTTGLYPRQCRFLVANASETLPIKENQRQHIQLGFRMIPVLSGKQMLSYLNNISSTLNPGDFWIGSIAIPEEGSYEKNNERARTGEHATKKIPATPMGGVTFVHRPAITDSNGKPVPDELLASYLSQKFNSQVSIEDLYTPVTNSYYTIEEFDQIAQTRSLEIVESSKIVCKDDNTPRLVIVLKKTKTSQSN